MGPGSVGGIALPNLRCDTLVFLGRSSDCTGNGRAMGRGTMRPFHGFPTILEWRGIRR